MEQSITLYDVFKSKMKAFIFSFLLNKKFGSIGCNFKFRGARGIRQCGKIFVGDNCWIEAVFEYREQSFSPELLLGNNVMLSNNVHISCIQSITICDNVLIGSNVYIGDHSHGSLLVDRFNVKVPPFKRQLDDSFPIHIGKNVWIGDGVVILAGSYICDGCVVAANAVVKGQFNTPCVIGGVPAKSIKALKH